VQKCQCQTTPNYSDGNKAVSLCRFLKWDDAPCDLNTVGGIKVLCEVELR